MERLLWGAPLRLERIESVARFAGWDVRYLQRDRGVLDGVYSAVTGQGTTLAWGEADRSVHAIGAHPDQLALFLAWRRPFGLGGTTVGTSELLVLPPGGEVDQVFPPGCDIATIFLPWRRVTLAAESLRLDLAPRQGTAVLARDDVAGRRFERALDGLRNAALVNPAAWIEREAEFVETLCALLSARGPPRPLAAGRTEPGAAHARRTRDLIEGRFREVVRMEDICRELGIGTRQVERCFLAHYGMTPRAYLKLRRLNEARTLMLRSGPCTSVTTVALAAGFSHLGRFAADYRQLFGEYPRQSMDLSNTSPQAAASFRNGTPRT